MSNDTEKMIFAKTADALSSAEKKILAFSRLRKPISTDAHAEFMAEATFGDRLADSIARIGGSWSFISIFFLFLFFWTTANTILLTRNAFDPYPFIFLNLVLSMLAAIQAPIIMMSQNRQSERDRFMAAKDYEINLKAEIEVLGLHQKIDMQVLMEIKQLRSQVDSLCEDVRAIKPDAAPATTQGKE